VVLRAVECAEGGGYVRSAKKQARGEGEMVLHNKKVRGSRGADPK